MTGKLITNDTHILAEKMRNVIPNCENIYALVGYFYFSGFSELSEDVKNKKMKILVGMDIDALISGKLREVSLIEKIENESSDIEIRKEYYEKLTTLITETDSFDSSRQEKSLKLFIEKIKDGTLEKEKQENQITQKFISLKMTEIIMKMVTILELLLRVQAIFHTAVLLEEMK
jgi:hypothetical protein